MYNLRIFIMLLFVVCGGLLVHAASLTSANHWVPIGDTGNGGDTNPAAIPANCGNVDYACEIMQTEVAVLQYNECSVIPQFTNSLIPDEPVRFVSFSNAMVYADWLTTNAPVYFTNDYNVTYTNGTFGCWNNTFFTNYLHGAYSNSTLLHPFDWHVTFTNWTNYIYLFPNPIDDPCVSNIISGGGWVKLSGFTNYVYLLPTEDEWYKAAYGKINQQGVYYRYPSTNTDLSTNEFNYGGWSNEICVVRNRASVSSYGAYDMGGNVWEWIEPNTNSPAIPLGMAIIRGGSYFSRVARDISVETREYHAATNAVKGIGFRLIRIPIPQP